MTSNIPPPPTDTVLMALEVNAEDIHFVDNIMKSHDNLAQVRRDFRTHRGRPCYEVWIAPDLVEEVQDVIAHLRPFIDIGICELVPNARDL